MTDLTAADVCWGGGDSLPALPLPLPRALAVSTVSWIRIEDASDLKCPPLSLSLSLLLPKREIIPSEGR